MIKEEGRDMEKGFKKIMRKVFWLLLLSVVLLSSGEKATAGEYRRNMNLDGAWVNGEINNEQDVYLYRFTTAQAGEVMIEYQAQGMQDSTVSIWNADLTKEYWNRRVDGASVTNPKTSNHELYLEKGTYYVKVVYKWGNMGTYRVRGSFVAANNNETEPNDLFTQAMKLSENGMVTGLISEDDNIDIYSFTIVKKQRVNISHVRYCYNQPISIWDKDYKKIDSRDNWGGGKADPRTTNFEFILEPGTYYIKVEAGYSENGKYTVVYHCITPVNSIQLLSNKKMTVGQRVTLSANVLPAEASNKQVTWETSDSSVAIVNEGGAVIAKRAGEATIKVISQDDKEIKAECSIMVNPKKMSVPRLKKKAGRKLRITWSKQSNVSGYVIQYATNKSFKGAKKVKSSSYYNKYITKKLKKKTYYVRVRSYYSTYSKTYYGAWSGMRKIRMK